MKLTEQQTKISHLHNLQLWDVPRNRTPVDILKKLSYIQLDTISVVARSQDLICHTRSLNYKENAIWKELDKGNVFEDFVHARCLVHTDDFPYHYSKMISRRGSKIWWQSFFENNPSWLNEVLNLVVSQDGISIKDIPVPTDFPKGTGWNRPQK
ncbi:MAG: DNA glycosylase AlkZ-like family protein, partial [Candidatus Kariarchaeaceae archaeon]